MYEEVYCTTLGKKVQVNSNDWYDLLEGVISHVDVKIGNQIIKLKLKDF